MQALRKAMTVVAAAIVVGQSLVSCEDEKRTYVKNMLPEGATPTMVTTDVRTLISDSGYTRYHIDAPVWRMFDDLADPLWTFPDGIELEQYDDRMNPTSHMRCDSAIYFSRRRLWRLDGHVVMVNIMQDTFLTSQMYWDQNTQKVYSDSFMHITRASHIIEGYGFESNQAMTAYTVNRPTAIIPVDRSKLGQSGGPSSAGQAATDTLPPSPRGIGTTAPAPQSQRSNPVLLAPGAPVSAPTARPARTN